MCFVWFVAGIIAGLILGNYCDKHDILYSCPRCKSQPQRVECINDESYDNVMQAVLSRVWETGETVIATVDEDGKATITDIST